MKKRKFIILLLFAIALISIGLYLIVDEDKKDNNNKENNKMNARDFGYILDDYDMKDFLITRFSAYGKGEYYEISAQIFNRTDIKYDELYLKFILYNDKKEEFIYYTFIENLESKKSIDIFFQVQEKIEGLVKYKVELSSREEMIKNGYDFTN